jgi:hypothetical protein
MFLKIKNYFQNNKTLRKVICIIFVVIGLLALVTPLTPGAWLFIVGLELLGIRILFLDKFKFWKKE